MAFDEIQWSGELKPKPAHDDALRPREVIAIANIRAWMMATPFTVCPEWKNYVDHMLETLSR